jgi:hypothetical protein
MRSDLRLVDLEKKPSISKLMNVKVPVDVSDAIDRVAKDLGCSKTDVVIALLNEGLEAAKSSLKMPPAGTVIPRRKRRGRPRKET